MAKETIKDIIERRSIRKYKAEQIKDEELDMILQAGIFAPSGMGRKPVTIVAVQDKETRDELEKLNKKAVGMPDDAAPFYGAPTVLVVLYDPEVSPTAIYDGTLVMGNLMNAAHAIDVDSCWIHRAKETFEMPEGKELLKKWGLKESLVGIGNCILGYRDCEYPPQPERHDDMVVYVK
ncbi:MAG: nitroreductase [Oscillospiraceae bacterium]|nr:nitroreductase [Oscillospiraceae bacterium]